jgi:hypothetical protein
MSSRGEKAVTVSNYWVKTANRNCLSQPYFITAGWQLLTNNQQPFGKSNTKQGSSAMALIFEINKKY